VACETKNGQIESKTPIIDFVKFIDFEHTTEDQSDGILPLKIGQPKLAIYHEFDFIVLTMSVSIKGDNIIDGIKECLKFGIINTPIPPIFENIQNSGKRCFNVYFILY